MRIFACGLLRMKDFFSWLIQSSQANTLAQRLLTSFSLISALLALLALSVNLSLGLSGALIAVNLLAVAVYGGLYLCARLRQPAYQVPLAFVYLSLLILGVSWFFNGGISGAIPLLHPVLVVVAFTMLRRQDFALFFVSQVLSLVALLLLESLHPEWVIRYADLWAQRLDLFCTLLAVMLILGISFWVFRAHYEQEQRLLQLATDYKSRFLAQMSHELRTPLNAVLGFTRVLQQDRAHNLNAVQVHYLDRIQANGQHLLQLVNDLLDLSQIEAGHVSVHPVETPLPPLLADMRQRFQALAESKHLAFSARYDALPSVICTDPVRLRQILDNLLGNAIKYTHAGHVALRVQHQPHLLVIQIEDSGPGISPEEQALIYQPFYQGKAVSQGGVGLGLAITLQLCHALGYTLRLRSRVGEGSCFSLEIPLS